MKRNNLAITLPVMGTIITVGVALGAIIVSGQRENREDVSGIREDVSGLRERMAHVEGLLQGLREVITQAHNPTDQPVETHEPPDDVASADESARDSRHPEMARADAN